MDTHHHPDPIGFDVAAAARGDRDALDAAVLELFVVGAQALADDDTHGPSWGLFADWCHRTASTAAPATVDVVEAWLAEEGRRMPAVVRGDVLRAIAAVHAAAGLPDPTGQS